MTDTYTPERGKVVVVGHVPPCQFCDDGTPGPYDFKTAVGPWANGCKRHWLAFAASIGLGVGRAQLWITPDQVEGNE